MTSYQFNQTWSDKFLPEVKRQIGAHLLKVAPDDIDQKQATDLMMLDARDTRVAVRVRRPGYHSRYPNQFTIRSKVAVSEWTVAGRGRVIVIHVPKAITLPNLLPFASWHLGWLLE